MVKSSRVALGGAGIVAPAKSDLLWGAGGGPGNRSGIFNVYLGAGANGSAGSWLARMGQLTAAGVGGRQKGTPRRRACTGHLKLWLSIQSEARRLSSNLDTTTTSGAHSDDHAPIPRAPSQDVQSGLRPLRRTAAHQYTKPIHPKLRPSPGRVAVGRIHHGQKAHALAPIAGSASEESEQKGG